MTYTITPTAVGCVGSQFTAVVTVNPVAKGTATTVANSICSNSAVSITLNPGAVSGTTFEYTSVSSTTVTGATALCNSGCGTSISDNLSNSGVANGTVTYHITPWANSCAGTVFTDVITVRPVAAVLVNAYTDPICSSGKTNVMFHSTTASTILTYTTAAVTDSVTGFKGGSGTTSVTIAQTLVNSAISGRDVTYSVTSAYDGCPGSSLSATVTVNPVPRGTVTTAPASSVCSGTQMDITLNPNAVSGVTFTFTAKSSAATTVGGESTVCTTNCNPIADNLTNSGIASGTITYTITPHANGCAGPVFTDVITVKPIPVAATNVYTTPVCSHTVTNIALSSPTKSTTYTYTASGDGIITGFAPSGSTTSTIAQTLVNTGTIQGSVTYTITPVYLTCQGSAITAAVTVNPVAKGSAVTSPIGICSGSFTDMILVPGAVSGTTFTYKTSVVAGISGASCPSGGCSPVNDTIIDMLTTTATNSPVEIYTITPWANSCAGTNFNVNVTVQSGAPAKPIVTGTTTAICPATGTYTYTITNLAPFNTVNWKLPVVGSTPCTIVTGSLTSNPITISYPAGYVADSVTVRVTNLCGNTSAAGGLKRQAMEIHAVVWPAQRLILKAA